MSPPLSPVTVIEAPVGKPQEALSVSSAFETIAAIAITVDHSREIPEESSTSDAAAELLPPPPKPPGLHLLSIAPGTPDCSQCVETGPAGVFGGFLKPLQKQRKQPPYAR